MALADQDRRSDQDRPEAEALFEEARRRRRRIRTWTAIGATPVLVVSVLVAVVAGQHGGSIPSPARHGSVSGAPAAGGPSERAPAPLGAYLPIGEIGLADPQVGWAVNGLGLYLSSDAGRTWRTVTPPLLADQDVVARIGNLVAIGSQDLWLPVVDVLGLVPFAQSVDGSDRGVGVERSTDGGQSWSFSSLPGCLQTCGGNLSLSFTDPQHGFAADGPVLRAGSPQRSTALFSTADGGATWTTEGDIPAAEGAQIVFTSPTKGWALTEPVFGGETGTEMINPGGLLYRTTDGGHTWQVAPGLPSTDTYELPAFFGHNGVVLAIPPPRPSLHRPVVYTTRDGGSAWTEHPAPKDSAASSYSPGSPGYLPIPFTAITPSDWKLFIGPALYSTTDAGQKWAHVIPTTNWPSRAVSSMDFWSAREGMATAQQAGCPGFGRYVTPQQGRDCYSVLWTSVDGGLHWTPRNP